MSPNSNSNRRLVWSGRALAFLFVTAALSQAKLQILERGQTIQLAEDTKRFVLTRVDRAKRGAILASDLKPLAQDEDMRGLDISFSKAPACDAFFLDLAAASGIPAGEFEGLSAAGVRHAAWRTPLTGSQAKAVQTVKVAWRADGVSIGSPGRRSYSLADASACVVGLARDGKPMMGLELSQNKVLQGANGLQRGLTDRQGQFLPMRLDGKAKPRVDGKDIVLTIDSDLQTVASAAVRKAVETNDAVSGVALVMDPRTGDILAMANWPSFSPFQPDGTDGDLKENSGFNPAYMAVLEPGSTFKILTLAKALDMGKTSMTDVIHCGGVLHINNAWKIHCDSHHGNRAHGEVNAQKAIAKSCNVAAATWALRIGRPELIKYVQDLGLLEKTHMGLPMEQRGQFNYKEYAKLLQVANVGFGQSISCTPVALVGAFSMIANGGVRMEPRLIDRIGGIKQSMVAGKRLIRAETAAKVLQCMEGVIESDGGTGAKLRIPGYRLAGKTGTAQKISKHEHGYVSNFVGFVPAENPRAVVLIMINNPKGGDYYGATVAGPAFVEVSKAVIRRYNIPPSEPEGDVAETPRSLRPSQDPVRAMRHAIGKERKSA